MKQNGIFQKCNEDIRDVVIDGKFLYNKKQIVLILTKVHLYKISKKLKNVSLYDGLRFSFKGQNLILETDERRVEYKALNIQTLNLWDQVLRTILPQMDMQGHYEIEKLLGNGSFASVYMVRRRSDGKLFAAKAFLKKLLYQNDANGRSQIQHEINTLRAMDHPNILKLIDVFENKAQVYIVTDLARGGTLEDALKKLEGPLPFLSAKVLFRQIVEGVRYIHEKGFMHRDLKPSNIIFLKPLHLKQFGLVNQDKPNAIISDFGIASRINNLGIYRYCGSSGYMAPEVSECELDKNKIYDEKCDIFSLGCIFYQIMNNRKLFNGHTSAIVKQLNRICDIKISEKETYGNKQLFNLLNKMLSRDPQLRPTCQEILNAKILHVDYDENGCPIFKDYKMPVRLASPKLRKAQTVKISRLPQLQRLHTEGNN